MTARLSLDPIHYRDLVRRELTADLGDAGDLTTNALIPDGHKAQGAIIAREAGRVCGLEVGAKAFRLLDRHFICEVIHSDGTDVAAGSVLARISGYTGKLLSAERTALNLLGQLSGVATATRDLAALIEDLPARVADTRKTIPGLRALQKYAVRVGGGSNHRFGLYDAVLIKDNHRAVSGSIAESIDLARSRVGHVVRIEIEVDNLEQLNQALATDVDAVLLDNFTIKDLVAAVSKIDGRVVAEASGNISALTIRAVAETGVDIISVGRITHSSPSLDVALDLEPTTSRH